MKTLTHRDLTEENRRQIEEALGPDNRWFAGQHLGHPPTDEEAIWWYINNGGAAGHRARMESNPPPQPTINDP